MRQRPPRGQRWAADTGLYGASSEYSDARYLQWLDSLRSEQSRCLFATAPDVVGDAAATLARSRPMLAPIAELGYPVALVAQDGLTIGDVPWSEISCLFVGGTTRWKLSEAAYALAHEAQRRGLWAHLGRVNSWRRFRAAAAAGYDSCDGTVLRFDPERPVWSWQTRAEREPTLRL